MQIRQSPISSRNRSTTIVRSSGTTPGRLALVVQVGGQVAGGQLVQLAEPPLAHGLAHRDAQLERPADAVALPERHLAGHAGRRRDQHPVAGDLLDPPRGRAQLEHLALPGLVHHLLVELADAGAGVGQEHAVQAAVGDGAAGDDGQAAGAVAGAHACRRSGPRRSAAAARRTRPTGSGRPASPARPRTAPATARGRDRPGAPGRAARPPATRPSPASPPPAGRARPAAGAGTRVCSISPSRIRRTTTAVSSRSPRHLGKKRPTRRLADAVAGPADALQAGGHRLGRLDLDDQVDGAHVDAELERGGRDQRRQLPRLQQLLDLEPLLAGDRAVVRAGDRRLGELVQPVGDALGRAAVVDEHDRRAVRLHQLQQPRVDAPARSTARGSPSTVGAAPSSRMSSTGTTTSRSSGLRCPASTIVTGRSPPRKREISSSGRCVADRPIRCGSVAGDRRQPLQRERQVRAALGAGDGVDLVDDHRLDRAQHVAGAGGQHQVQRLGRGDQDVGRVAADRRALGWGVSPLRSATATGGSAPMPASGARRLRSTSWFSARSGET